MRGNALQSKAALPHHTPKLYPVAILLYSRSTLAFPISSACQERVFSKSKLALGDLKRRSTDELVEARTMLAMNYDFIDSKDQARLQEQAFANSK